MCTNTMRNSRCTSAVTSCQEGKALLGAELLADTRAETRRRQAAIQAKEALEKLSSSSDKRKPTLKRANTMMKTARVNINSC
jgi:multidrug resistance efflux pump